MTTSDNVLDNIDHALHDWDMSPDAMRWTPEPVNAPQPPVLDVTASMIRMGEVMRDAQEKLARAFTNMATSIIKIQVQIRHLIAGQREAEARIRRSALHSEYHRRQKRRKR